MTSVHQQCDKLTVYFAAVQTINKEMGWRFTDNSLSLILAHKETASTDIVKVYDTIYDVADDIINTVLLNLFVFSTHGPPYYRIDSNAKVNNRLQ